MCFPRQYLINLCRAHVCDVQESINRAGCGTGFFRNIIHIPALFIHFTIFTRGGECEKCIALIVDGDVISGPPFHPNCDCELTEEDIEEAEYHESNLHDEIGTDRNSGPDDVKWLKESLEKLGFYNPDTRAGESAGQPNPYPNQRLFDAIDDFRKSEKIKETGSVKPGHWTEVKINEALKQPKETCEYHGATFEKPINVNPNQYAVFDGKVFTVHMGNGHTIKFAAMSGKPEYQDPKYQDVKDGGPIPEGTYVARQEELQKRDDYSFIKKYTSWPGFYYSWGNSRVWLEPSKETNTYDRDAFSIHGGVAPGSNGCIDLTSSIKYKTTFFYRVLAPSNEFSR